MSRSRPSSLLPRMTGILAFVLFLGAMEAAIQGDLISRYVVPPPSEIIAAFPRLVTEGNVLGRFLATATECLTAGVLLTVFGVLGGALLSHFRLLRRATESWVGAWASAPIVLMYPLFLVIFGRSAWTVIMIGFISALPPVMLKTLEGLSGTRQALINVGRSFNLTPAQQFRKIQFPAAMPVIFVGIRLGLIYALINIVGVEFLINFGGLGALIGDFSERYDLPGTYATICFVILVSIVFFMSLERVEQWLRPGA